MNQNEIIQPLPVQDFEKYCEQLAHQILDEGITYDFVLVLGKGAFGVWAYLKEVLQYKREIYVPVTRYPDGQQTSRCPPEFGSFPESLHGAVLIVDDCADDGDTMHEGEVRASQSGAELVHSAVVLCKPANLKIHDDDWRPTFIGWADAPGHIYFDFPREAFYKRVMVARQARQEAVSSS